MTNRERVEKKLNELGYELGCYDSEIDKLSKVNIDKVLKVVEQEYIDVDVRIRRNDYVVEVSTIDNEKDLMLKSKESYTDQYGDERWDD